MVILLFTSGADLQRMTGRLPSQNRMREDEQLISKRKILMRS
jgi:hypothetical protein